MEARGRFLEDEIRGLKMERGVKRETRRQIFAFENAFGDRIGILGRTAGVKAGHTGECDGFNWDIERN